MSAKSKLINFDFKKREVFMGRGCLIIPIRESIKVRENQLLNRELQYNLYAEFLEQYVNHINGYNQYLSSGKLKKKMTLFAV